MKITGRKANCYHGDKTRQILVNGHVVLNLIKVDGEYENDQNGRIFKTLKQAKEYIQSDPFGDNHHYCNPI